MLLLLTAAWAEDGPIADDGPPAVQNRFFLKKGRLELAPGVGYVPNNPFVYRYVGSVTAAWHFSENLAAEGRIAYDPDLGSADVRPLVRTLLVIGQSGGLQFQQPLEKTTLAFSAAVRWAPLYGKINLGGEAVVNCDVYGVAGLGMLSKTNYVASLGASDEVRLDPLGNEVEVTPILGLGVHLFASQSVAFGLDIRDALYLDAVPVYDPEGPVPDGSRLYNEVTTSIGVSVFVPRMKPRMAL
jgi:outer membrane beta-barrel protein